MKLGQVRDMQSHLSCACSYMGNLIMLAQDFIYNKELNVAGVAVECLLSEDSWVPMMVKYPQNHIPILILTCA